MKKKVIIMGVAAALVLCAIVGGTVAAPTAKSEKATTTINIEDLGVAHAASFEVASDKEDEISTIIKDAVPGQKVFFDYTVGSAEKSKYDIYVRVVIDKAWVAEKDAGKAEKELVSKLRPEYIHLLFPEGTAPSNDLEDEIDSWYLRKFDGWYLVKDDSDQAILYYERPLATLEETPSFIAGIEFDSKMDNYYTDKTAELTVIFSAVQANRDELSPLLAEKAMLSEWGVYPIIDENGVITQINHKGE